MAHEKAYQLCVGLFPQKLTSGTAYNKLEEADYKALTWDTGSIIPVTYKFTNITIGDSTLETTNTAFITDIDKIQRYSSGAITPGQVTFNHISAVDQISIYDTLRELTGVADPYLCLLMAGLYNASASNSTARKYDVFYATPALVTGDGGIQGEALNDLTGTLTLQPTGTQIRSTANCAATLTWTLATNAVAWAAAVSGGNP